jgi:hypothetical protein
MINYKTIINDFATIAEKHKQINSFGTGDLTQLIYLTQDKEGQDNTTAYLSPTYPLLYVVPGPVARDTGSMSYSFSVIVMDLMSTKDYNIENQLLSDTLQIIDDILAQFKYSVDPNTGLYQNKYDVNIPLSFTPFTERFDDFLVGWTMDLSVIVDVPINRCIAPFDNF